MQTIVIQENRINNQPTRRKGKKLSTSVLFLKQFTAVCFSDIIDVPLLWWSSVIKRE